MEPSETISYADSLAHQAYRVLEQAIVTLALAPGSLVTEKQLIDLAGQGRTPVREAILKLEWQGLIVVKPRSGLRIADIAPSDWQNVMAVRRRLEPEAAALVARHADDGQRRRLVECARDMSTAAVMADTVGFLAADKRFDDIMEHACPNRFLSAALVPLRAHARRLWCATATTELMDRAVGLHLAVIRAIQTGDCVEAAAATGRLLDALADLET